MRITRGTRNRTLWQSVRLFGLSALAVASLPGFYKSIHPTVAAESEQPVISESPQTEPVQELVAGPPSSTTATELKPAEAILTWTPTGSGFQEDAYDLRVSATSDTDPQTGELVQATAINGISGTRYDATQLPEGQQYWQVRSCNLLGCSEWSPVWSLRIDGTAPGQPTIIRSSNEHDVAVSVNGTAEPGSKVTVVADGQSCDTTAASDGTWSCAFQESFGYGDHAVSAVATDNVGNSSVASQLSFSVSELFVAPPISAEELPAVLTIVPVDETPENEVFKQPVTSVIDVVNRGGATDEIDVTSNNPPVLSTDGGIVQSSGSGWQVLGLPWFIWLGGAASLTGGWWAFGAPIPRRSNLLTNP